MINLKVLKYVPTFKLCYSSGSKVARYSSKFPPTKLGSNRFINGEVLKGFVIGVVFLKILFLSFNLSILVVLEV